jgi:hypothetical protein
MMETLFFSWRFWYSGGTMNVADAGEKIRGILKWAGAAAGPAAAAVRRALAGAAGRALARVPPHKRPPVLALAGLGAALLVLAALGAGRRAERGSAPSPGAAAVPAPDVPAEELFIPAEPDFLPAFLLEQEPRHAWSAGDVQPYWKNPGDANGELWREEIRRGVDAIMEGVP